MHRPEHGRRTPKAALVALTVAMVGLPQLPAVAVVRTAPPPPNPAAAAPPAAGRPVIPGLVRPVDDAVAADPRKGVLRSQRVHLDPELLPDTAVEAASGVELQLFPDTRVVAEVGTPSLTPAGYQVWDGRLAGADGSSVVLIEREGSLTGFVSDENGASYTIRTGADGTSVVEAIDTASFPAAHAHPSAPVTAQALPDPGSADPTVSAAAVGDAVIDVLVGYTAAAEAAIGGQAAMEADVALAIEQTNRAFATSGVNASLRLVHATRVASNGNADSATLDKLRATGDGWNDELPVLRDQYGADLVAVIVDDTLNHACGVAYQMTHDSTGFAPYAMSSTDVHCSTGNMTFAHEIGHNFGAAHDRGAWSGAPAYPYGYDWVSPAGWRTVMAYPNACNGCPRLLRFSNPDQTVDGATVGAPIGAANAADNRALLNTTAATVTGFRGAPAAAAITVTGPVTGERVPAPSKTAVTWATTGNVGPTVRVELLRGSTVVGTLATAAPAGTGRLAWSPPKTLARADDYRVRVTSVATPGVTAVTEPFAVVDPSITVTSHGAATAWPAATPQRVTWTYTGVPATTVKVEVVREDRTVKVLAAGAPLGTGGAGGFTFTPAAPLGDYPDYRIRVTLNAFKGSSDVNDADQAYAGVGAVRLTSPDTGGSWTAGASRTVTWSSSGTVGGYVKLELVKGRADGGVVAAVLAAKAPVANGTVTWTAPAKLASGDDYRVRVVALANPALFDSSDVPLTVDGTSLTLTGPATDTAWVAGTPKAVTWTRVGVPGTSVRLELVRAAGTPVVLAAGAPITAGTFTWTPPLTVPPGAWSLRATVVGNVLVTDTHEGVQLARPGVAVTSPSGPATWTAGAPVEVSWQLSDGVAAPVDVQLVQGTRVVALATRAPTAPGGAGSVRISPSLKVLPGDYTVKVRSSATALVAGTSVAPVTLRRPTLTTTAPTAGATWRNGAGVTVGWQLSDGAAVPVRAQLVQGTRVVATPVSSGATAADGTGAATWTVPATLPAGSYVLRLRPVLTATTDAVESSVAVTVAP